MRADYYGCEPAEAPGELVHGRMIVRFEAGENAGYVQPVFEAGLVVGRRIAAGQLHEPAHRDVQILRAEEPGAVGQAVNIAADLLEKPRYPRFQEALHSIEKILIGIIEERRSQSQDTGDLLSMLWLARDEETGEGMNDRQLRDQVITLLLAGYETTASALTWTWFLLALHPNVASRMRDEVAQVLFGRSPVYADLPQLQYTRRVFEESLRMYPPAWILGRKALADDEIGGYLVPAGPRLLYTSDAAVQRPRCRFCGWPAI